MKSQNLRLVNYFTDKFYYGKTMELAHIASPSFGYISNSCAPINFEEYAVRRDIALQNVDMLLGEFTSEDDIHFKAEYRVSIKNKEIFDGEMTLKVVRGLLQEVKTKHNLSTEEFERMENTFKKGKSNFT